MEESAAGAGPAVGSSDWRTNPESLPDDTRSVIVLTHVPPFREACWYQGHTTDDHWAPFFVCGEVGQACLLRPASDPTANSPCSVVTRTMAASRGITLRIWSSTPGPPTMASRSSRGWFEVGRQVGVQLCRGVGSPAYDFCWLHNANNSIRCSTASTISSRQANSLTL